MTLTISWLNCRALETPKKASAPTSASAKVRASVLVWSRGPDGLDDLDRFGKPVDDSLSWPHARYEK